MLILNLNVQSVKRKCISNLEEWVNYFLDEVANKGVFATLNRSQFCRDLDLMGLQRHLKVMGIFARLSIRDKKPRYLADIPLVIQYFLEVSRQYPELAQFMCWFTETVLPPAKSKLKLES